MTHQDLADQFAADFPVGTKVRTKGRSSEVECTIDSRPKIENLGVFVWCRESFEQCHYRFIQDVRRA